MTLRFMYSIKEPRRSPRAFRCSACKGKVEMGSVYIKTNWGRYCNSCGKKLPSAEQMLQALGTVQ